MLKTPHDYTTEDGARFITKIDKKRVDTKYLHLLSDVEFKLILDENKNHVWTFGNAKAKTKDEILKLLDEGLSQTDIADTLAVHKGTVSKIRTQAIKNGLLTPKNKLTQDGFMFVNG
jgi:DNA-binding MarR family transcriptional regulator